MSNATWGMIGHDWAVEQLQTAIVHGRIGHAYLITGPQQVGRNTLARKLAQALNCTDPALNNRPCGVCRACKLIANDRHPDVITVEPTVSGRGIPVIKIDQIRQLQRDLTLAAVEARHKIGIIRQFDAANIAASNAFLKTLEEPPPNVVLILTASDADALLDTITSRCRTLSLRPVSTEIIQLTLENQKQMLPPLAERMAHLANGRIGWALSAADEEEPAAAHEAHLDLLESLLDQKRVGRFQAIDKLSRKPEQLPEMLQAWQSWWRDAMLLSIDPNEKGALINLGRKDEILKRLSGWGASAARKSLAGTDEALVQLSQNGNVRLVLENLTLTFPIPK